MCEEFGAGFEPVDPKSIGIRKRIVLCRRGEEWIVAIERKSRLLQKDAQELVAALGRKRVNIYIKAPLCSKAKRVFEEAGWSVHALL